MTSKASLLFSPIRIGAIEVSGRLVKAATVEGCCTDDGFVTDELLEYYEQIAGGGTRLLITGATCFDLYSRMGPRQLNADHDNKIPGLRRLTDAVHRHDSKIFMQIYHTGRQAMPHLAGRKDAVAPSPVLDPALGVKPRAMTPIEILETIQGFSDAAVRAKEAGFDGVQIHAAHGYLISAFLTPHTNRRTDAYGGSFENRIRFLVEVYRAIRQEVGQDYPIIMKLNGSDDLPFRKGLMTENLVEVAQRMEDEGMDAVEISAGHYESGWTFERSHWRKYFSTITTVGVGKNLPWHRRGAVRLGAPFLDWGLRRISAYSEGFNLKYSKQFKQALTIPVICVGGFIRQEEMERAVVSGECDMVSVARALIADPFLYRHMQENVKGPQCDFCNLCFARATAGPIDCFNEEVGAQKRSMLQKEANS